MLNRSTIFVGLMLTGSLAIASLMREEDSPSSEVVSPAPRMSGGRVENDRAGAFPALQLYKMARAEFVDAARNPFAGKSWYAPPPPPPVITMPKEFEPHALPPLPFKYMGRLLEEGERPLVFFSQGSQVYSVRAGGDIDGSYRLESVSPTQVVLVYLPLNVRQTLAVGSLETEPEAGINERPSDAAPGADTEPVQKPGSGQQ